MTRKITSNKNNVLREQLKLKDAFAKTRHTEKKELANLRFKLAIQLLNHRDVFAEKRHRERLELLMKKYGKKKK